MVVQRSPEESPAQPGPERALQALAEAGRAAADAPAAGLDAYARAALEACAADAAVVRLLEAGSLVAHVVHATSPALAAQLEGSRIPVDRRNDEAGTLRLPIEADGAVLGSLEVVRRGAAFTDSECLLAQLAADALALVLRTRATASARSGPGETVLALAGEALAAGADDERTQEQVVLLAAEASNADTVLLWRSVDGELALGAGSGTTTVSEAALVSAARVALDSREFLTHERIGGASVVSAGLDGPAGDVLQLVFSTEPDEDALAGVVTYALRAAHTLRAGAKARAAALELERTRALLALLGQATANLSLAHTLATAIEQTASLLGVDRVAVYLREDGRLHAAAGRALVGPHELVAELLLGLVLGPLRGRGIVVVNDVSQDAALAEIRVPAEEAGIVSALALPLVVGDGEVIGLLVVYPDAGEVVSEHEQALLVALASRLGIALQNARLHEQATQLGGELEVALATERDAARRVRALYEVSQSFAQSLSLDAVLDSLASSTVELLGVDAAAIHMPDERRELLTNHALHVANPKLDAAARAVLARPQPFASLPLQRLFRRRLPLVLTPKLARELGGSHELLAPFLEKGSTVAVLPVATPVEVVATLTIVSFDPGRPIVDETVATVLSLAAQAALAIDNGRLYQQQKEFSDTMQRSLLPRSHPVLPGLEIGEVYESSARVDVGGDVYDFLELADGRLAVVLGDVTGHGIEATADMAMAKFVFRSLAREHPSPGDFLASANEVVHGEIATGKFITMAYVTVDAATGSVVAASAGHPAPLVLAAGGGVTPIDVGGLALGVDAGQSYEEATAQLEPGDALVVFTDGVIEARRDGELYGDDRLAAVLTGARALPPAEIAQAVIRDCRAYAGGELPDDCAVVVIKRTA